MNNVYPLATEATLHIRPGVDAQEVLCTLFAHSINVTAITVDINSPVLAALADIGARVVMKNGRYEVVK